MGDITNKIFGFQYENVGCPLPHFMAILINIIMSNQKRQTHVDQFSIGYGPFLQCAWVAFGWVLLPCFNFIIFPTKEDLHQTATGEQHMNLTPPQDDISQISALHPRYSRVTKITHRFRRYKNIPAWTCTNYICRKTQLKVLYITVTFFAIVNDSSQHWSLTKNRSFWE